MTTANKLKIETTMKGANAIPDDELLTIGEAAALLKVSRSWIYKRMRQQGFPALRLGSMTTRFSRRQLLDWAVSQTSRFPEPGMVAGYSDAKQ
jgi:excisionase family DNA binding protein